MSNKYTVYTDGSLVGKERMCGGWAALVCGEQGRPDLLSGNEYGTTSNRMEMTAVIKALSSTPDGSRVYVVSDSQYVMNPFLSDWLTNWISNGWKTAHGSDVKNSDLWQILAKQCETREVSWHWVRGHSGHPENSLVDKWARKQAADLLMEHELTSLLALKKIGYKNEQDLKDLPSYQASHTSHT